MWSHALVVAVVLVWTGGFKLLTRTVPPAGLSRLVGPTHVVKAFRALGALELVVAAALLVTPLPAIVLFTGFLGYLGYTRSVAPESSCGCSSAQTHPIGRRNFVFAGLPLVLSVLALAGNRVGWPVLVLEGLALALITPDLDRYWLYPLRRLKVRLTHPLAGAGSTAVPLDATVDQLQRSEVYRQVGSLLRSDVVESWDEGQWRLIRYTVLRDERPANAIFAVPLQADAPHLVRLAIVD